MHYFDYAATSPICLEGKEALLAQVEEGWCNPSAQYQLGLLEQQKLNNWRAILADSLGCDPSEFYFTSGGTESNNWAIKQGVTLGKHRGKHCITSTIEHPSVLQSMKELEKQGYSVSYLPPNKQGYITAEDVIAALREDTVFISIMLVNNETGVIFPVEEIAQKVKKMNPNIIIHCDAVQGFLKIPFQMSGKEEINRLLNIDLLSISGHKVNAPKGIGGLFVRKGVKLPPLLHGGGQEFSLRSGTEATHQIAAFSAAVKVHLEDFQQRLVKVSEINFQVIQKLSAIKEVKFHYLDMVATAPHILSFSLVGYPSQVVLRFLSEKSIYISAGSACHKGKESHVFATLPLSKKERTSALRLSFSPDTTQDDINALITGLIEVTETLCSS